MILFLSIARHVKTLYTVINITSKRKVKGIRNWDRNYFQENLTKLFEGTLTTYDSLNTTYVRLVRAGSIMLYNPLPRAEFTGVWFTLPFKVNVKVHLSLSETLRYIGRREVQLQPFLTAAVDKWSASRSGSFSTRKEPCFPFIKKQGGPRSKTGWFWRRKSSVPVGIRTQDSLPLKYFLYHTISVVPLTCNIKLSSKCTTTVSILSQVTVPNFCPAAHSFDTASLVRLRTKWRIESYPNSKRTSSNRPCSFTEALSFHQT
jgi:hypothetical protein